MSSDSHPLHTITLIDSQNFAQLSGDFNKIHLDVEFARRQPYGSTVVHGIHVVLLALSSLEVGWFQELQITFSRAISQGEFFYFVLYHNQGLIKVCDLSDNVVINIHFREGPNLVPGEFRNGAINPLFVEDSGFDSLTLGVSLSSFVQSRMEFAHILFPNLVNRIGAGLVSELARLSSIIGMQIPGKFSILSNAKIEMRRNLVPELAKITFLDSRARFVKVTYSGQNVNAELSAFSPLPPAEVPPLDVLESELLPLFDKSSKKSLVIGGSRGLGEWISKTLAILGREVTLTYSTGKTDAQRIQSEIWSHGMNCRIIKFDVLEIEDKKKLERNYDEVYYCATPRIRPDSQNLEDFEEQYKRFENYYVHAFTRIVDFLKEDGTRFFFPSSTFLDKKSSNYVAYVKSKERAETNCDSIIHSLGVDLRYLRLPMLDTDQTRGIWRREAVEMLKEIKRIIKHMD